MRLKHCHNTADFRELARRRLPAPLFHYIDGGADDESTLRQNTEAFDRWDLVPNVLAGIDSVDLSVNVFGKKLDVPLVFSPTAMQRLFHQDGEHAVADAAAMLGTAFGLSTIGTRSIEEMGSYNDAPKIFQMYIHNDPRVNADLIERTRAAGFDAMALTVDTIVAGNRERDLRTGMTTPPKLTLSSLASFAVHPGWTLRYLTGEKFELPNVGKYIRAGSDSNVAASIVDYINEHISPTIDWDDAARMVEQWNGAFAIKGVMSVPDAQKAVEIGATAIMISNHGGRQLDGSRSPFDQLEAIVDAVGGQIEIILDGGIRRGSHILKALALGATACSGGRFYLYALAAGGTAGVLRASQLLRAELERDMKLMGCHSISELKPSMLAKRP